MNIKKLSFISLALVTGLGALFTYVSFMSNVNENNEGKKAIVIGASSWVASPQDAAQQIYEAIKAKKKVTTQH